MMEQKNFPRKRKGLHGPCIVGVALVLLLAAVGILYAGDHLSASINGKTVNYSVTGVEKNADFKIIIKNLINYPQPLLLSMLV